MGAVWLATLFYYFLLLSFGVAINSSPKSKAQALKGFPQQNKRGVAGSELLYASTTSVL
jgi:hypothetical protein